MNIELDFNFTHIFKGVHKENFSLACQHELLLEKQALKNRRSEDKMVELIQVIFFRIFLDFTGVVDQNPSSYLNHLVEVENKVKIDFKKALLNIRSTVFWSLRQIGITYLVYDYNFFELKGYL